MKSDKTKVYLELLQQDIKDKDELESFYIYALWKDRQIVYIGQTVNLETRLSAHRKEKDFDQYSFFKCGSRAQMENVESQLIAELRPSQNRAIGDKFISFHKVRSRIRALGNEYKYDQRYYVNRLGDLMESLGIKVTSFDNKAYIHIRDLEDVLDYVLKKGSKRSGGRLWTTK